MVDLITEVETGQVEVSDVSPLTLQLVHYQSLPVHCKPGLPLPNCCLLRQESLLFSAYHNLKTLRGGVKMSVQSVCPLC